MSTEIEAHILERYEVKKRLGKGVSVRCFHLGEASLTSCDVQNAVLPNITRHLKD